MQYQANSSPLHWRQKYLLLPITVMFLFSAMLSGCQELKLLPDLVGYDGPIQILVILNDDLLSGEVMPVESKPLEHPESGTFELKSTSDRRLRCTGSFLFTGKRNASSYDADLGVAEIECTNGVSAVYSFEQTSSRGAGFGCGRTTHDYSYLIFGHRLTAERAAEVLILPKGKHLVDTMLFGPQLSDVEQ